MENQRTKNHWGRKQLLMMMLIYAGMIIAFVVVSYTILIKDLKSDLGNKAMVLAMEISSWMEMDHQEFDRLVTLNFSELIADPTNVDFEEKTREVMLKSEIKYIYLLSVLPQERAKYHIKAEETQDYNVPEGTPLTGIYVLDSVQSDALRQEDAGGFNYEDRIRYTIIQPEILQLINEKEPAFILNTDEWGTYLTGFAPYYSDNGDYLGMIGVDLFPDKYYAYIKRSMGIFGGFLFMLFLTGLIFSKLLTRVWNAEERIRLENELANMDTLTGLMNQRCFNGLLTHEYAVCRREGIPLTLMLADLENFTQFNRIQGEPAGNQVLIATAEYLSTQVKRSSDALCRFGGDEFGIFLHNTEAENAVTFAEFILSRSPHPFALGILVIMPEKAINQELILEQIKEAVEHAKKAGSRKYAIMDETR